MAAASTWASEAINFSLAFMAFPCSGHNKCGDARKRETRWTRRNKGDGLSLPYDGITRTGSKGLSQLRRHRRGTPNETSQVTGITHFKQDSPDFEAVGGKFVPGVSQNSAKVFLDRKSTRLNSS